MIKILKEDIRYKPNIGDIISLFKDTFEKDVGRNIVEGKHLFVVVKKNPLTVCPISSKNEKVSSMFPWNINLKDWKEEGLTKPSHVKVDVYGKIKNENTSRWHSSLTEDDLNSVILAFNEAPKENMLENFEEFFENI